MARRGESEAERAARARLKERHAVEVRAYGAFFDVEDRRAQLEAELTALDEEQAGAVAAMVAVSEPSLIAEVIGWSTAKVRAAAKLAADSADEIGEIGDGATGGHHSADGVT